MINYTSPYTSYFGSRPSNPLDGMGFRNTWGNGIQPINYGQGLYDTVNSRMNPVATSTPSYTPSVPTVNYGLADTRANTIIGADLSAFRTPTETTNWFGKTTQGFNYDHAGAFKSLMENPDFNNYFHTLAPQQQQWLQNNTAMLNTQNLETINAQMNSALAAQANNAWTKSDILGGVQAGVGTLVGLGNLWSGYQQTKLMKANFEEQKALNRANFTNQAKQINNAYRDQASGRGTTVMSDSARRSLGDNARKRFVRESY